jgi:hypothetical protein
LRLKGIEMSDEKVLTKEIAGFSGKGLFGSCLMGCESRVLSHVCTDEMSTEQPFNSFHSTAMPPRR